MKPGFQPEKLLVNLIAAALFSGTCFAQTPINGFCKYDRYTVPVGYRSFITLNYNDDSYTDFLLYNSDELDMELLQGVRGNKLHSVRKIKTSLKPEYIINLREKSMRGEMLFLISPLQRRSEAALITERGLYINKFSKKYTEYPRSISSDDINGDGVHDLLLAGINFNGMSILTARGSKYEETRMNKGETFEHAVFVDLNHDGYPDILTYEPFKKLVYLFSNNSRGIFRFERSLHAEDDIQGLYGYDVNLDGLNDFVLLTSKNIIIYYAEPTGAFLRKSKIPITQKNKKLVLGDYNRDGKIDISALSEEGGVVTVYFQGEGESFFEPFVVLANEGIADITNYFSRFIDGIALLDEAGYIHTVTRSGPPGAELSIVSGGEPTLLGSIDNGNNGIADLIFYDNKESAIKFLLRDKSGIPYLIYKEKVLTQPTVVLSSDAEGDMKSLILWKEGERFVELMYVDLVNFRMEREYIYFDGKIEDIRFTKGEQGAEFAVIYSRSGAFSYRKYLFRQAKPEKILEIELGAGIVKAMLDETGSFYLFKITGLITTLEFRKFGDKESAVTLFRTERKNILPQTFFLVPINEAGEEAACGLIIEGGEEVFLVRDVKTQAYIINKRAADAATETLKQKAIFSSKKRGNETSVYFLTERPREILLMDFEVASERSSSRKFRKASEIKDFMVKRFNRNQRYFITALTDGLLQFRRL